jgi:ankyrin repeat protein
MVSRRGWAAALATCALLAIATAATGQQQQPAQDMLIAAARGDAERLQRLITDGAPLDPTDAAGRTPLLLAVQNNQEAAAKVLIEAGSNINAQSSHLDTPWLLAGARGRTEMIRLMIPRGPDYRLTNRYGGSALVPACHYGHVDTVRLLLTTEIDVNQVNNFGWTCLLEVVVLGNGSPPYVEIAKMVLAAGADPNIADKQGVTPVAHALRRHQTEVAKAIADAGGR